MMSTSNQEHGQSNVAGSQRSFTGRVTKYLNNFGFVDDDVFFSADVLKGRSVQVGDIVHVECSYSEQLPFKWNATKVEPVDPRQAAAHQRSMALQAQQQKQPLQPPTAVHQPTNSQIHQHQHGMVMGAGSHDMSSQSYYTQYSDMSSTSHSSQSMYAPDYKASPTMGQSNVQSAIPGPIQQPITSKPNMPPALQTRTQPPVSESPKTTVPPASYPDYNPASRGPVDYYGRQPQDYPNSGQYSHLTYTSTPGSAFMPNSPMIPYANQSQPPVNNNKVNKPPPSQPNNNHPRPQSFEPSYKTGSRWEDNRNRAEPPRRDNTRRDPRVSSGSRFEDRERPRERDRDRNRDRSMDWSSERSVGDRSEKSVDRDRNSDRGRPSDHDRDKHSNRDRDRSDGNKHRNTESPSVNNSSSSKSKRRYDPVNIPKYSILKPFLTVYDIKQRYGTNIHIPSDFKEVRLNSDSDLNVMNIPKPITFVILDRTPSTKPDTPGKVTDSKKKESGSKEKKSSTEKAKTEKTPADQTVEEINKDPGEEVPESDNVKAKEKSSEKITESSARESTTAVEKEAKPEVIVKKESSSQMEEPSSKNSEKVEKSSSANHEETSRSGDLVITKGPKINLCNKYGVKVILLSLPSVNDIFDRVFGADRETNSNNRNHNEGHTLIGGKFDPIADGFLDNSNEPNLIATAIRSVRQHTGIDLSVCRRWNHILSFVYNRDDSILPGAPLEFSYVFMPDIWSLLGDNLFKIEKLDLLGSPENEIHDTSGTDRSKTDDSRPNQNDDVESETNRVKDDKSSTVKDPVEEAKVSLDLSIASTEESKDESGGSESGMNMGTTVAMKIENTSIDLTSQPNSDSNAIPLISEPGTGQNSGLPKPEVAERQALYDRLHELKVADLRSHLERRGVKIKSNCRKVDLIFMLREKLLQEFENDDDDEPATDSVKENWWTKQIFSKEDKKKGPSDTGEMEPAMEVDLQTESTGEDSKPRNDETNPSIADEAHDESLEKPKSDPQDKLSEVVSNDSDVQHDNNKRKLESEATETSKKPKTEDGEMTESGNKINKEHEGCIIASGDGNLTLLPLQLALTHHKYDHFELAITAEILREKLTYHFCHYIISAAVHNKDKRSANKDESENLTKVPLDNGYTSLAFSYFDSSHCGYLLVEDLLKLFHNCNFPLSKKVWTSLLGTDEKLFYRTFKDPPELLKLTQPKPYSSSDPSTPIKGETVQEKSNGLFTKDGTVYDINKLIEQSDKDEALKNELKEKVRIAQQRVEKQREQLKELQLAQNKVDEINTKNNDEISKLKKERDSLSIKYKELEDAMRKMINTFNQVTKKHEEDKKEDKKDEKRDDKKEEKKDEKKNETEEGKKEDKK